MSRETGQRLVLKTSATAEEFETYARKIGALRDGEQLEEIDTSSDSGLVGWGLDSVGPGDLEPGGVEDSSEESET